VHVSLRGPVRRVKRLRAYFALWWLASFRARWFSGSLVFELAGWRSFDDLVGIGFVEEAPEGGGVGGVAADGALQVAEDAVAGGGAEEVDGADRESPKRIGIVLALA